MEREGSQDLIQRLLGLALESAAISNTVMRTFKKECSNLTSRIEVLALLFKELRETGCSLPDDAVLPFRAIHTVLRRAKDLLQECQNGSQFVLILDREETFCRFWELTEDLRQAFESLPVDSLDISDGLYEQVELFCAQLRRSDEVQEKLELVRAQLKRTIEGQVDSQDEKLFQEVSILLIDEEDGIGSHPAALQKLAEKLHLENETSWMQELKSLEGRRGAVATRSEKQRLHHIINILKRIQVKDGKDFSAASKADKASLSKERDLSPHKGPPLPPHDFKCPISLELMKDPVVVATGQTYERSCIQKWLDNGHITCPKTRERLSHLALTPNFALRSLIAQWCEANELAVPQSSYGRNGKYNSCGVEIQVGPLLVKLASTQMQVQRGAAGELRLLMKTHPESRPYIAESGAIPILISLLSTPDSKTQEHAVTALLNLSSHQSNKRAIVRAGAIDPIVEALKHGTMEARENAAATLFSLSAMDEHKVTIGNSGAISALVLLLQEGQSGGKKDAAAALYSLSIHEGNKVKAIKTGIVPTLMELLVDISLGMVDEALVLLAVLATQQEGRVAIGGTNAIPTFLDLIRIGSPHNKANAASVLLALCRSNATHVTTARILGATEPLTELLHSGTRLAKHKASGLLRLLNQQDSVVIGSE